MKRTITALIATAVMTSATAADFNFPSAAIPGGHAKEDVKQIISYIWDDNAYSGKAGTNYEGPTTEQFQFGTNNWINSLRSEGGWITTKNKNELNLTEGMIGMSWAAHTLAGEKVYPYKTWENYTKYEPVGFASDTVIHNDSIWACMDWAISQGSKEVTSKTAEGKDTTVTVDDYNPPKHFDTTGTFTVVVKEIDPTTGLWVDKEKSVTWSELEAWDKTAIKEEYKAWTFVDEIDLARARINPDGSNITMTFNVISGLMVPTFPIDWQKRESKYGYYKPSDAFYPDGYGQTNRHERIAVSWGREMPIYTNSSLSETFTDGYITEAFKDAIKSGHELGNHTIDHMESNSPLPFAKGNPYLGNVEGEAYLDGFSLWDGEGFDSTKMDPLPWGGQGNEAEEFGQKDGNPWQFMGWSMYAGKRISEKAWGGAIKLSENELDEYLGLSIAKGNLYSFRAPRLEVSSGMFFALANQGYEYDCGNEEGYEMNRDGTNFVWPYTTDNGTPNNWTQSEFGEDIMIDSMPSGLWQYPVNTMIVPDGIRQAVWDNHNIIATAEGEPLGDISEWNGKVTGFDFNMFILWAMTGDQVYETLKHTLDLRLAGNKAPMQVGCHTDYFTPIYDNATLSNDVNKDVFGLCLQNNTWEDRIRVFEEFTDYGISVGANFKSGHETIQYVKSLLANPVKTLPDASKGTEVSGTWYLVADGVTAEESISDLNNITVDFSGNEGQFATYIVDLATPTAIEAIQIPEYTISSAVKVGIRLEDGKEVFALLNNLKKTTNSGLIPMYQLEVDPYTNYSIEDVDLTQKATAITINIKTPGTPYNEVGKPVTQNISLGKIKYFTADDVALTDAKSTSATKFAFQGIKNGKINLSAVKAGDYSINLYSMNGRVVKTIQQASLTSGANSITLGSVPAGMYILKIAGQDVSLSTKAVIK